MAFARTGKRQRVTWSGGGRPGRGNFDPAQFQQEVQGTTQKGKMQVTGFQPTFPEYDSCDAENNTISETIDWNPNAQFYLQVNANAVFNTIKTIYPRAGTVAAGGAPLKAQRAGGDS